MPMEQLLAEVKPFDYGKTWEEAFRCIERNAAKFSPDRWEKFMASIRRHGIRRPISLMRYAGVKYVVTGHHHVWAIHKLKRTRILYTLTDEGG